MGNYQKIRNRASIKVIEKVEEQISEQLEKDISKALQDELSLLSSKFRAGYYKNLNIFKVFEKENVVVVTNSTNTVSTNVITKNFECEKLSLVTMIINYIIKNKIPIVIFLTLLILVCLNRKKLINALAIITQVPGYAIEPVEIVSKVKTEEELEQENYAAFLKAQEGNFIVCKRGSANPKYKKYVEEICSRIETEPDASLIPLVQNEKYYDLKKFAQKTNSPSFGKMIRNQQKLIRYWKKEYNRALRIAYQYTALQDDPHLSIDRQELHELMFMWGNESNRIGVELHSAQDQLHFLNNVSQWDI